MSFTGKSHLDQRALLHSINNATLLVRAALLDSLRCKAGFRPNQLRVPSGQRHGGRWTDENGDADLILVNGEPDDPDKLPDIPKKAPPTIRERNRIAKSVARFLVRNAAAQADFLLRNAVEQSEMLRDWLIEHARDRIISYQDLPKTLDELQSLADEPAPGYEIHHIVEQEPARQDGIPEEQIQGWRNKVRIPKYRHEDVTAWFARGNVRFGGLSPREYLRGASWYQRYKIGLEALRENGVLK